MAFCAQAQKKSIDTFIESYKIENTHRVLRFADVIHNGQVMTESEALQFVYYGDTSRLFCQEKVINMENERDFRIARSKHLPKKNFRLITDSYTLTASTQYECKGLSDFIWQILTLKIMTRDNLVVDSLLVYKANDYDYEVTGTMNTENQKIFLSKIRGNTHDLFLYKIDGKTLRFIEEGSIQNQSNVDDDLSKTLKAVGWLDRFIH